jgi:hypothetical protein
VLHFQENHCALDDPLVLILQTNPRHLYTSPINVKKNQATDCVAVALIVLGRATVHRRALAKRVGLGPMARAKKKYCHSEIALHKPDALARDAFHRGFVLLSLAGALARRACVAIFLERAMSWPATGTRVSRSGGTTTDTNSHGVTRLEYDLFSRETDRHSQTLNYFLPF